MNQTTKETRRRSYDAVLPKRAARCRLILETLGNRELRPVRSLRSSSQPDGSRTSTATTSPRGSQS